MRIELERVGNHFSLHLQGGWVSREISNRVEATLKSKIWNFNYIGGRQSSLGDLGNEIKIIFNIDAMESACQEYVDYLNLILRDVIPTGFTVIHVNPYALPEYENCGGLTAMLEIAKETGCPFDPGEWMHPCSFKPENTTQYNKVIELLRLFKMKFNNWDYVNGVRPWLEEAL